jgi:hypothetical protein
MKIADRRLQALTGVVTPAPTDKKALKKAEEEAKEWGPLPKVGRAELLGHYAKAIEEAVAKLEDAHERNQRAHSFRRRWPCCVTRPNGNCSCSKQLESQVRTKARGSTKVRSDKPSGQTKEREKGSKSPSSDA